MEQTIHEPEVVLWPSFRATMQRMRQEGWQEGQREVLQAGVIQALAARGLELSGAQRRRLADAEVETLRRYFDRALSADTTTQVFDDAR